MFYDKGVERMMNMSFITITGCDHYLGTKVLRLHQKVVLKKDLDNVYDGEAVAVYLDSGMKIGYVANSIYTVAKGTYSAGRIYDTFDQTCEGEVMFILGDCAIAQVITTDSNEE